MTLGKALRLRRIFAQGRALVADCHGPREDPVGWVRLLARHGPDGVVCTPGLLDAVVEDLGSLSVILRMDPGARWTPPLLSVQAALEMGAEAVALRLSTAVGESLERFGRISEEARRLGMPVLAEVSGENWWETARLSADYGADLIRIPPEPDETLLRNYIRATGKPLLVSYELRNSHHRDEDLRQIWRLMQGPAQGLVFVVPHGPGAETGRFLQAVHALVHQDVSLEEARAIAGLATAPE